MTYALIITTQISVVIFVFHVIIVAISAFFQPPVSAVQLVLQMIIEPLSILLALVTPAYTTVVYQCAVLVTMNA